MGVKTRRPHHYPKMKIRGKRRKQEHAFSLFLAYYQSPRFGEEVSKALAHMGIVLDEFQKQTVSFFDALNTVTLEGENK